MLALLESVPSSSLPGYSIVYCIDCFVTFLPGLLSFPGLASQVSCLSLEKLTGTSLCFCARKGEWGKAGVELVLDLLNNDSVFLLPSLPNKKTVCYSLRLSLFFYIALRASRQLHNRMLAAVLRSPLRFFDTNPLGGWGYCLARYRDRICCECCSLSANCRQSPKPLLQRCWFP